MRSSIIFPVNHLLRSQALFDDGLIKNPKA